VELSGCEGYQLIFPPVNNVIPPDNPIAPPYYSTVQIVIVFVFTFLIEGTVLWFLINRFLKPNPRFKPRQILILVLIVNMITFFLGNYVLIPFIASLP